MNKNVQIPIELFYNLLKYFYTEEPTEELYKEIKMSLKNKLDQMVKHDLYTQFKTANSIQEREEARQKYLNKIGINDNFRW